MEKSSTGKRRQNGNVVQSKQTSLSEEYDDGDPDYLLATGINDGTEKQGYVIYKLGYKRPFFFIKEYSWGHVLKYHDEDIHELREKDLLFLTKKEQNSLKLNDYVEVAKKLPSKFKKFPTSKDASEERERFLHIEKIVIRYRECLEEQDKAMKQAKRFNYDNAPYCYD